MHSAGHARDTSLRRTTHLPGWVQLVGYGEEALHLVGKLVAARSAESSLFRENILALFSFWVKFDDGAAEFSEKVVAPFISGARLNRFGRKKWQVRGAQ